MARIGLDAGVALRLRTGEVHLFHGVRMGRRSHERAPCIWIVGACGSKRNKDILVLSFKRRDGKWKKGCSGTGGRREIALARCSILLGRSRWVDGEMLGQQAGAGAKGMKAGGDAGFVDRGYRRWMECGLWTRRRAHCMARQRRARCCWGRRMRSSRSRGSRDRAAVAKAAKWMSGKRQAVSVRRPS